MNLSAQNDRRRLGHSGSGFPPRASPPPSPALPPIRQCGVPVDVSFVMDGSGSMAYDVYRARDFVRTLSAQLNYAGGAQSSVVMFSYNARTLTDSPQLANTLSAIEPAVQQFFARGYTNIGSGLQEAVNVWRRAESGVPGAGRYSGNPKVIVLLSDGENTEQYGGHAGALRVADEVKASGVTIFAVGFSAVSQETLRALASTPCAHQTRMRASHSLASLA